MAKSRSKKEKAKQPSFVLDCSVTVAWFFEDEISHYAEAVVDALASTCAVVPQLWPLEVANALLVGERRKRTTEARVSEFLGLLRALPITLDEDALARTWSETLHLARAHQLSVYDASYLEVALHHGLPLATLDDGLRAAANAVGVTSYAPI